MKRSEVSVKEKFRLLGLAIGTRSKRDRTDVIGVACQLSRRPKLKREDFNAIMDISLRDIINATEKEL
jgi:hypothetical protein